MSYENTGRLFLNERKTKPNQPDYTGDYTTEDGTKMKVAAWLKPGTDGRAQWLSFRVSEQQRQADPLATNAPAGDTELDDEIPF